MNKYQEALNNLIRSSCPSMLPCKECNFSKMCNCDAKGWIDTLQELVDRATLKKPINKTKNSNICYENCDIVICPHCGKRLKLKSKGKYCDKCGGALDWSEENEIK